MTRWSPVPVLALALTLACGGGSSSGGDAGSGTPSPAPQPPPYAWIQSQARPLAGADPSLPDTDLAAFGAMVGDAHLVGLGEATHGTSQFFQMKDRLFRYLARNKGFTTFGIEADMGLCLPIDAYVQGGAGDVNALVQGQGFWTWSTREVVGLVEWMRAYNLDPTHATKLHFVGFDMQDGAGEMDRVLSFLHGVDPAAETKVAVLYQPFRSYCGFFVTHQDYSMASAQIQGDCHAKVLQALQWITDHETAYGAAATPAQAALARRMAQVVVQSEAMYSFDPSIAASYDIRDAAMADNALWWLQQQGVGAREVLWAHNLHIDKGTSKAGWTTMGQNLKAARGADYLNLGFGMNGGTFRGYLEKADGSRKLQTITLPPCRSGSIDQVFKDAGISVALFDFRGLAPGQPGPDWMLAPHSTQEIGAVFYESHPYLQAGVGVVPERFDLYLFMRDTTAAVPITPP